MRLRLVSFPHVGGYNGPTGHWSPGDVREVDDVEGARLLSDFGAAFELVEPPVTSPPQHTAVTRPPQARTRGR